MCPYNKLHVWHAGIAAALTGSTMEPVEHPLTDSTLYSTKVTERGDSRESFRKAQSESQRRQDGFNKLRTRRDEDQSNIRERRDRALAIREQRFEALLNNLTTSGVDVTSTVSNLLRKADERMEEKKHRMYHTWNAQVHSRIQSQIDSLMHSPGNRCAQEMLQGSKSVGFDIPGDKKRACVSLGISDGGGGGFMGSSPPICDPMKQELKDTEMEMGFRQAFREVNRDVMDPAWPRRTGQPEGSRSQWRTKNEAARSRPILEPTEWDQLSLQATPYAHFAQMVENQGAYPTRTSLKMSGFALREDDGVSTAGKRRTKFERNSLGVLEPGAMRGEASKVYTSYGGSSGAPSQDHYHYAIGTKVTDIEFPLGKRIFAWKH